MIDLSLPSSCLGSSSSSIVFLGHPINTGARKTAGAGRGTNGSGGRAKLTVTTSAWSLGKNFLSTGADQSDPQGSTDLREFSIESQSSKRFRPRFPRNEDAPTLRLAWPKPLLPLPLCLRIFFHFPRSEIPIFLLNGIECRVLFKSANLILALRFNIRRGKCAQFLDVLFHATKNYYLINIGSRNTNKEISNSRD